MGSTRVSEIIEPTIFVAYIKEQTILKSALVKSGIIDADPRFDELAERGGLTINMPFFKDLTGAEEVLGSGTGGTDSSLTPSNITSGTDIAALFQRGKAWGSEDLAADIAGKNGDPMMAIADRVVDYWIAREQAHLITILQGLFLDNVANDSSDLTYSIVCAAGVAATASNFIGTAPVIRAKGKLGDSQSKVTAIAMHSTPYDRLQIANLIDTEPKNTQDVGWGAYLGMTVIVDDTLPSSASGTRTNYTSYLFGQGAIARGEGSVKVPVETDRDALAGVDYLMHRKSYILHPRGIKYAGGVVLSGITPSNTECANASSWDRVYEKKNIRIVQLITSE